MKSAKVIIASIGLGILATPALAGEPPKFRQKTYPQHALGAIQEADKALMGPAASLDAKTRELIALGVAAQVPCAYCVYFHNRAARAKGATEAEIREAVATAAHVRHWSTVLNGMAYNFDAFKTEVNELVPTQ